MIYTYNWISVRSASVKIREVILIVLLAVQEKFTEMSGKEVDQTDSENIQDHG